MSERATKTIDAELSNLDLGRAGDELERLNNEVAPELASQPAGNVVPTLSSAGKSYYSALDPATVKLAEEAAYRIHGHLENSKRSIVEIGNELNSIKSKLDHGLFGKWLEAEFDMTAKTAQNYMNVARMVEQSGSVLDLNLSDTSLQLLASPNADSVREVLTKTIAIEIKAGKPTPKPKRVKEMIAKAIKKKPPVSTTQKSTPTAIAAPMDGTSTPMLAKIAAEVTPLTTAETSTTIATKGPGSAPVTAKQIDAATKLVNAIKKILPNFAKLYDIAGHEVFQKAMADALKTAATQPQQTTQAA